MAKMVKYNCEPNRAYQEKKGNMVLAIGLPLIMILFVIVVSIF